MAGGEPADAREERITLAFRAYGDAVFGYASSRLGPVAAEEVVADTFLAAWRRIDELDDPLLPWLLGTARRMIANELRRRRRSGALVDQLGVSTVLTSVGVDHEPTGARVRAALATLSSQDQDVLMMSAWYDLTAREAARALGCTTPTYTVRLHRARRRLRDALGRPPIPARLSRTAEETA